MKTKYFLLFLIIAAAPSFSYATELEDCQKACDAYKNICTGFCSEHAEKNCEGERVCVGACTGARSACSRVCSSSF
jgi:hypothetical protein